MLKILSEYDKGMDGDRVEVNSKHFKIIVVETKEGIIVDVYGENALITTNCYWDMDEEVHRYE